VARYILNFFSGYFNEYPQLTYAIIGYEVLLLIYLFIRLPYKKTYLNIIAVINECVVLLVLSINMVYRNFIATTESGNWYGEYVLIPAWIQLGLLILSLVANYIGMFIYIYYKCCRKGSVHPAERLEKDDYLCKNNDINQS
jgi:hypothetical protein